MGPAKPGEAVAAADRGREELVLNELTIVNNELANLQRELAKRNFELVRLNEEKNLLVGMAAHDLRTPLGVIMMYSEFLKEVAADTLSDEHRQFLTVITERSKAMLRMVEDLLDVAAIDAGRLRLERGPTDLEAIVRRSVELNNALAARKGIAVEFASPGLPVMAHIDGGKIEQVLNNLISNAIKFSHSDSTVRVMIAEQDGNRAVHVVDEGQGIPAGDLSKLFTPFSTASVRSTAGETCTGLGLAIVRRLVEGHGGTISVASKVGVGSTFTFTVPYVAS